MKRCAERQVAPDRHAGAAQAAPRGRAVRGRAASVMPMQRERGERRLLGAASSRGRSRCAPGRPRRRSPARARRPRRSPGSMIESASSISDRVPLERARRAPGPPGARRRGPAPRPRRARGRRRRSDRAISAVASVQRSATTSTVSRARRSASIAARRVADHQLLVVRRDQHQEPLLALDHLLRPAVEDRGQRQRS